MKFILSCLILTSLIIQISYYAVVLDKKIIFDNLGEQYVFLNWLWFIMCISIIILVIISIVVQKKVGLALSLLLFVFSLVIFGCDISAADEGINIGTYFTQYGQYYFIVLLCSVLMVVYNLKIKDKSTI